MFVWIPKASKPHPYLKEEGDYTVVIEGTFGGHSGFENFAGADIGKDCSCRRNQEIATSPRMIICTWRNGKLAKKINYNKKKQ